MDIATQLWLGAGLLRAQTTPFARPPLDSGHRQKANQCWLRRHRAPLSLRPRWRRPTQNISVATSNFEPSCNCPERGGSPLGTCRRRKRRGGCRRVWGRWDCCARAQDTRPRRRRSGDRACPSLQRSWSGYRASSRWAPAACWRWRERCATVLLLNNKKCMFPC
jgi:hypothetical protein